MHFQTTLEAAECLRRSDAGWPARGAATKNARSPIVVRYEDGVTRADVDEDRSLFFVSTTATRRSSLVRCRHRKTRTESLERTERELYAASDVKLVNRLKTAVSVKFYRDQKDILHSAQPNRSNETIDEHSSRTTPFCKRQTEDGQHWHDAVTDNTI